MNFDSLAEYNEKQREHINALRRQSEKFVLVSISEALGLGKKQLERLKYEPGQISGLCISAIMSLQRENAGFKKTIAAMRETERQNAQALFGFIRDGSYGGKKA